MKLEKGSILRSTEFKGTIEINDFCALSKILYVSIKKQGKRAKEARWNYYPTIDKLNNGILRIVGGTFFYRKVKVAKYEVDTTGKILFLNIIEQITYLTKEQTEKSIFQMLKIERYPDLEEMAFLNLEA